MSRSASVVSTPRYEEVAHYRQEMEEVKKENEALKQRIRDLERLIKGEATGAGTQAEQAEKVEQAEQV